MLPQTTSIWQRDSRPNASGRPGAVHLYQITVSNLDFIFENILGLGDRASIHKRHYTSVRASGSEVLISMIDRNFETYLDEVLLNLSSNAEEDVASIISILNREELQAEPVRKFLVAQTALIPDLEQVPVRFHTAVFELSKIEPSWANCLALLSSESHDAEILTAYLNQANIAAALSQHIVPDDDEAKALRSFLIENAALRDDAYRRYVRALPKPFTKFPVDLGPAKLTVLIEEARVKFSPASLAQLEGEHDLQLLFVLRNIDRYLPEQAAFGLDDDFRDRLLISQISDEQKLTVMEAMDLTILAEAPARAAVVGPIFARTGADMSGLGGASAAIVILQSRPLETQILLFNKLHQQLDDEQVRAVLRNLPVPFSEIKPGFGQPKLRTNEQNLAFVGWMKGRGFISSWKQGGIFDDDIRINLFRK